MCSKDIVAAVGFSCLYGLNLAFHMYCHFYATSLCSGYVFHSSMWGIREVGGTNASVMFGTSITNVLILTIKCERVCV
jgi:hypothetical protein